MKIEKKITTKCKSCGAEIFFVTNRNGKYMPLNADIEISDGTKTLWVDEQIEFGKLEAGRKGYSSHFSTCPDALKFRKEKK